MGLIKTLVTTWTDWIYGQKEKIKVSQLLKLLPKDFKHMVSKDDYDRCRHNLGVCDLIDNSD